MEYMQKQCFKCKKVKDLEEFYKHPQMPDGRVNKCKDCNKKDVRENYSNTVDEKRAYDQYRHRHSITRLFNHKYSMIKSRCTIKRDHGYTAYGKTFLSKIEWRKWCYEEKNYQSFISIYNIWVQSGFQRKLTPSIDRIDNNIGYITNNLQWLTLSENSKKHYGKTN